MQLTNRINRIQVSPTAVVINAAEQLKAKGLDIADFGPGEPDFPTPAFTSHPGPTVTSTATATATATSTAASTAPPTFTFPATPPT